MDVIVWAKRTLMQPKTEMPIAECGHAWMHDTVHACRAM